MGFFLASHCRDPSRCVFELPGYGAVARVPVGSSFWWVVWIFVVVLVGLLHPAEAHLSIPPDSDLDFPVVQGECQALITSTSALDSMGQSFGNGALICSGFWIGVCVCVLITWEAFKGVCRRRRTLKTAACQTKESGSIPMPLEDGVPNRARILYCLWQAGYAIDIEPGPSNVAHINAQSTFGALLERLSDFCSFERFLQIHGHFCFQPVPLPHPWGSHLLPPRTVRSLPHVHGCVLCARREVIAHDFHNHGQVPAVHGPRHCSRLHISWVRGSYARGMAGFL